MGLVEIILESLILIFAIVAGIIALKLHDLVKGGELGASWRWLIGAAVLFSIMECIEITTKIGYLNFTNIDFAISLIKAFVAMFIMLGFISYKRTLT
jgi:hypothetical protein